MCDLIEELILGEGEHLAERVFESDYAGLTAKQRYMLRLAAIVRLGLADLWLHHEAIGGSTSMPTFLLANLPHDCSEREVQQWVEARGFTVDNLRIVRDLVAGVSPAFAYVALNDDSEQASAQTHLDVKNFRSRSVIVRKVTSGPTLFPAQHNPT
jgi:hypothetical protein